jgi:hypothetical protein
MGASFSDVGDDTLCWVYVLTLRGGKYRIGFALEFPDRQNPARGESIVWRRCFLGVTKAIAYKLYLENMPSTTLAQMFRDVPEKSTDKKNL